jgi:hypothetical protein
MNYFIYEALPLSKVRKWSQLKIISSSQKSIDLSFPLCLFPLPDPLEWSDDFYVIPILLVIAPLKQISQPRHHGQEILSTKAIWMYPLSLS